MGILRHALFCREGAHDEILLCVVVAVYEIMWGFDNKPISVWGLIRDYFYSNPKKF